MKRLERNTVGTHCLALGRPIRSVDSNAPHTGGRKYKRLFPDLPAFDCNEEFLFALGGRQGLCDGSVLASGKKDDAQGAAGWPFFGQFLAHDITADRSPLQKQINPSEILNFRVPRANLECLYSIGPMAEPYLYDWNDPAKLLLGVNDDGNADDVPRNAQGIALIGDPRNDSHLIVSQLHVAFMKAHNRFVDGLRAYGVAEDNLFGEARRLTTWHYQWVILHDFLPRLIGPKLMEELLDTGPRYYACDDLLFIPFEFADAAYRYGHSQIRREYQVNDQTSPQPIFPDLIGFRPVPPGRVVDWAYLFDLPGQSAKRRAKKIDGQLVASLVDLPTAISGHVEVEAYHSLAVRDLQRGQVIGLPSREAVARLFGVEPLSAEEVGLRSLDWREETPLWYYILKEAEAREDGERLGAVGGRIVGEVLVGIINSDPESFCVMQPDWQPDMIGGGGEEFTLGDLLTFATGK